MNQKHIKLLRSATVSAVVGIAAALLTGPVAANAGTTVCCFRYWGVSNPGAYGGNGNYKQSPTVSLIDWGSVWVEDTSGAMTQTSQVRWITGSTSATGPGGGWLYADPGGEVSYAYARCGFNWTAIDPLNPRNMYCDIKYWA